MMASATLNKALIRIIVFLELHSAAIKNGKNKTKNTLTIINAKFIFICFRYRFLTTS